MVTQRGIEVNLAQIEAVLETPVLSNKKELQRLIARFMDNIRPFFLTLRRANTFGQTNECRQTFEAVKRYLTEPPILSSPKSDKQFYMYLAISNYVVSVISFWHIQNKEKMLVSYVSKAMVDAKTRYSRMEQKTVALKNASQKFCPYFQAHQVTILTNQPLRATRSLMGLSDNIQMTNGDHSFCSYLWDGGHYSN